jgi:hypothetical protein
MESSMITWIITTPSINNLSNGVNEVSRIYWLYYSGYDNDGVTFLYICLIIGCKCFLVIYIISVNKSRWFTVHISSLHFVDVIVAMLIFAFH